MTDNKPEWKLLWASSDAGAKNQTGQFLHQFDLRTVGLEGSLVRTTTYHADKSATENVVFVPRK